MKTIPAFELELSYKLLLQIEDHGGEFGWNMPLKFIIVNSIF